MKTAIQVKEEVISQLHQSIPHFHDDVTYLKGLEQQAARLTRQALGEYERLAKFALEHHTTEFLEDSFHAFKEHMDQVQTQYVDKKKYLDAQLDHTKSLLNLLTNYMDSQESIDENYLQELQQTVVGYEGKIKTITNKLASRNMREMYPNISVRATAVAIQRSGYKHLNSYLEFNDLKKQFPNIITNVKSLYDQRRALVELLKKHERFELYGLHRAVKSTGLLSKGNTFSRGIDIPLFFKQNFDESKPTKNFFDSLKMYLRVYKA